MPSWAHSDRAAHGRQQELLVYLGLHRQVPQSRRRLAVQFSHLTLDINEFEEILNQSEVVTSDQLKTAISLYRGELLPDLDSDWVLPMRARLHQRYVRAEELGIDPSAATRQLYEQLLQADDVVSSTLAVVSRPSLKIKSTLPSLIGREQEWTAMHKWEEALRLGAGCADVLLLVGETGIGKTRLLAELGAQAQTDQVQVLWGSGYTAEMMQPYGFWIDMLRSRDIGELSHLRHGPQGAIARTGSPRPNPS